jgi:hypothetical protein
MRIFHLVDSDFVLSPALYPANGAQEKKEARHFFLFFR